jgi:hypothetical protein
LNALVTQSTYPVSDLERMARAFAASKLFGIQNADQALALCLVAQAEGRHPASAAQDYHIISGRPAKKADAMLRDFIANGGKVQWHTLDNEVADATFSHPSGGTVRIDWTLERARAAGIANPMWKKYPRQMLRSRVVSEGVRTVCPGATSGMYVEEEVRDIVHEEEAKRPSSHGEATEPPVDDAEFAPIVERKKAAQAKRDGDDATIKAEIATLDRDGLAAWRLAFDEKTAHLPRSWLDSISDMLELRLEDLAGEDRAREGEAALDAEFRGTVSVGRSPSLANSHHQGEAA